MKINNKEVIIMSDLDGTYLDNKGKPVKKNTLSVQKWVENGGFFSFVSGRRPFEIKKLIPESPLLSNCPSVVQNGTALYDFQNDKNLYVLNFDASELRSDILKIQNEFKDFKPLIQISFDNLDGDFSTDNVDSIKSNNWCQCMVSGCPECVDKYAEIIYEKYHSNYFVEYWKGDYFRVVNKNANKGYGINKLKEYYKSNGIDVFIVAIGDHENDMQVANYADMFFCPSNAINTIKEKSTKILCSNDEGCVDDLINYLVKVFCNDKKNIR